MNGQREGVGRAGELEDHTRGGGFPGDSAVKNPSANGGDSDLILGSGRSPG